MEYLDSLNLKFLLVIMETNLNLSKAVLPVWMDNQNDFGTTLRYDFTDNKTNCLYVAALQRKVLPVSDNV